MGIAHPTDHYYMIKGTMKGSFRIIPVAFNLRSRKKMILIIEDDFWIQESLRELLEIEGLEVSITSEGQSGIEIANTMQPDLILCDLMLSDVDGTQVLSQIRQHPHTKTIPFIFTTAQSDLMNFRKAMSLGANDYLTKPFNPKELLAAINGQLQKKIAIEEKYKTQTLDLINYDQLTGLPNRLLVRQYFEDLKTAKFIPILCVSLDQFDKVKDWFGYEVGESLLQQAVTRLKQVLSNQDCLACLSTNEFIIIITQVSSYEKLTTKVEAILDAIQPSFLVEEQSVTVTASMGISIYPESAKEIDLLLRQANQGKKIAQNQGGNTYKIYDRSLEKPHHHHRITLETDLNQALAKDQLTVYYQPRVSLKTGEIVGMEALLRWSHPELGNISPNTFIPIAEETGFIIAITEWVCYTACQQGKHWQEQFQKPLKMAVNLSAEGFKIPNLCHRIEAICVETNFPPTALELELTESTLVHDFWEARQKLEQLQGLGIDIAIDDFGTGYASLNYLQQFSFQILKLDRAFVKNSGQNLTNRAIISSLIQLAHSLKLSVVAEGVERKGELTFLREQKCEEIQGYLFSPPISAGEMEDLLRENRHLSS